ncbi:MAG: hypothetical protein ACREDQ_09565 [Limisphaerales bacterium]
MPKPLLTHLASELTLTDFIALRKGPIELPSDTHGIVWIDISNGIKAAGEEIRKEVSHIVR